MSFVDHVQVTLVSGRGGKGAVHFQKTRRSPRGGPDGGNGGKGGDIILSVQPALKDLSHLVRKRLYKAEDGHPGAGRKKKGAKGKSLVLSVPKGTICYDSKARLLKELKTKDWCFLKGGKGGKGNAFFKRASLQAPQIAQSGKPSVKKEVILQLKWVSDICLVGFRGSGKTSFALDLSQQESKIYPSSYPRLFSIKPIPFSAPILVVDLPGLSSSTRRFLKQAERAKVITFVVSLMDKDPFCSYQNLRKELLSYDQKQGSYLTQKPFFVLLTGGDTSLYKEKEKLFHKSKISLFYFVKKGLVSGYKPFMDEVLKKIEI
ncbi:MAG: 50S ribosome-binding GTPase [Bdellovibrionales bacterium]|nr:50S ribosome-binding GTPase [Bdellovibrionales bacterium]